MPTTDHSPIIIVISILESWRMSIALLTLSTTGSTTQNTQSVEKNKCVVYYEQHVFYSSLDVTRTATEKNCTFTFAYDEMRDERRNKRENRVECLDHLV